MDRGASWSIVHGVAKEMNMIGQLNNNKFTNIWSVSGDFDLSAEL